MLPAVSSKQLSSYQKPKAGIHRSRSKSDLAASTQTAPNYTLINRFIQKILEMESDFAEIKERERRFFIPRDQPNNNLDTENRVLLLKEKLVKLTQHKYLPAEELNNTLERVKKLSVMIYSSAEFISVLRGQIEYVSDFLSKGYVQFKDQQTNKTTDLISYVSTLAIIPFGQEILASDKDLFMRFSHVQILALSKKMSLLYPRKEVHEDLFAQLIHSISEIYEKKMDTSVDEVGKLIKALNQLNSTINQEYLDSAEFIRKELSDMLRPKNPGTFPFFDTSVCGLLIDTSLIDDPTKESRRKALDNILNEMIKTETTFGRNVSIVAETPLFGALAKKHVITLDELTCLRKGWKRLQHSTNQLIEKLNKNPASVIDKLKAYLEAFSPDLIDEQMENCKNLMITYMESNKIIHKVLADSKGKQMMLAFSAQHRLDLIDLWIMPVQRPPRYVLLTKEIMKIMEPYGYTVARRMEYLEEWMKALNFFAPDFSR